TPRGRIMPATITRAPSKGMPYSIAEFNRGRRPAAETDVRPGVGAIPYEGGVAFRVWAPHAESVAVIGTFNDWDKNKHPLTRENGEGYWYTDIPAAKIGAEYRFALKTPWGEVTRIDPYAREVTNSIGNAVVHD